MEQLLRGIYQFVRNPRSHDKVADSESDAQTLITFLGYIVTQIDRAKAPYTHADFVRRVLDPDFVPHQRYAELLVAEIPNRVRLDFFVELYRENERWKPENMRLFLKALLGHLCEEQVRQICEIITEDLKISDAESSIRAVVGSFPPELWPRIGEAARLRIENKLIRSVRDGQYDAATRRCPGGALGTWSTGIFTVMTLRAEIIQVIASKLWSTVPEERAYVLKYLFKSMHNLSDVVPAPIAFALCHRLTAGDADVYAELQFGSPWDENTWPQDLRRAYASFQAAEPAEGYTEDDIPF
jgi:hypothetical protein